jgi:DNA polymerase III delta prime subunit
MESQNIAVEHPWESVIALPHVAPERLASGKAIINVFGEVGSFLLILGEPGAGKTTTLLELARDLLNRAEKDPLDAVPVVFQLSSWHDKNQTIKDWLVEELNSKYRVEPAMGRAWLELDFVLPLLDGLDEVSQENQPACVQAINKFIGDGGLSGIAVCSRLKEYQSLSVRLRLNAAICLQPLTTEQVDQYLSAIGPRLEALRILLKTDRVLLELTESPLMLNIMSLALESADVGALAGAGTLEQCRDRIFRLYLEKMFRRKGKTTSVYPEQKTIIWLSWLAGRMNEKSSSFFLVEGLQPSWLASRRETLFYQIWIGVGSGFVLGLFTGPVHALIRAVVYGFEIGLPTLPAFDVSHSLGLGLVFSLVFSLLGGMIFGLVGMLVKGPARGLIVAVLGGLVGGLIGIKTVSWQVGVGVGVVLGVVYAQLCGRASWLVWLQPQLAHLNPTGNSEDFGIKTVEAMHWSWSSFKSAWRRVVYTSLVSCLVFGLDSAAVFGLVFNEVDLGLGFGLQVGGELGAISGLILGMVFSLVGAMPNKELPIRTFPNQGLYASLKNGLICWLISSLLGALMFRQLLYHYWANVGFVFWLVFGAVLGVIGGMAGGGRGNGQTLPPSSGLGVARTHATRLYRFSRSLCQAGLLEKGGRRIHLHPPDGPRIYCQP